MEDYFTADFSRERIKMYGDLLFLYIGDIGVKLNVSDLLYDAGKRLCWRMAAGVVPFQLHSLPTSKVLSIKLRSSQCVFAVPLCLIVIIICINILLLSIVYLMRHTNL